MESLDVAYFLFGFELRLMEKMHDVMFAIGDEFVSESWWFIEWRRCDVGRLSSTMSPFHLVLLI